MTKHIFEDLFEVIENRKISPKDESYTSYLLNKGSDKILKKIGEESAEVIIGAKNSSEELIYEMADLWYHCLVLLASEGLNPEDIYTELRKRRK